MDTIKATGHSALAEMRRVAGLLRDKEGGSPELAPLPRLSDLDTLVEQVRAAGVPVQLSVDGEARDLAVGVELSAFRIVQESLTNAVQHGGPKVTANVAVTYRDDSLDVLVVDDGRGAAAAPSTGRGSWAGRNERAGLGARRLVRGRCQTRRRLSRPCEDPLPIVIEVLIADDQTMVRSGLRLILEAESDIVAIAEVDNGEEAVRLARREQPDVILMDWSR